MCIKQQLYCSVLLLMMMTAKITMSSNEKEDKFPIGSKVKIIGWEFNLKYNNQVGTIKSKKGTRYGNDTYMVQCSDGVPLSVKEESLTKGEKIEYEEEKTITNVVNRLLDANKIESKKEMSITPIFFKKRIDKKAENTFLKIMNLDDVKFFGRIPEQLQDGTIVYKEKPTADEIKNLKDENPNDEFVSLRLGCEQKTYRTIKHVSANILPYVRERGERNMTGPSSKVVILCGGTNQIEEQKEEEIDKEYD